MTDSSQVNLDRRKERLRHFPTMLERWRGGLATLNKLTSSHRTLTILITKPDSGGNLQLSCPGPIAIYGPFEWHNSNITVSLSETGNFLVTDSVANFRLESESIEIAENRALR